MLKQVFGQTLTILRCAENHGVLQEDALAHLTFEQHQQQQADNAEQRKAGQVPDQQFFGWEVAEQAHRLLHEQQQAEGSGPGQRHRAHAQIVAEQRFGIDAHGLKHQHPDEAEKQQHGQVTLLCFRAAVVDQQHDHEARQNAGDAVSQADAEKKIFDQAGAGQRKTVDGLQPHRNPLLPVCA